jgi:8-oxo-dGTP pyrophosphatase MutT (NUDIX family)
MLQQFLSDFTEQVREGNAGLFIGAGISRAAGFVDWKGLMKPLAEEIGLDIERETDYPQLAELYLQAKANRNILIARLRRELTIPAHPNAYHDVIVDLPLREVWTSNFDHLLEDAYRSKGKRCDVRGKDESFLNPRPADVTIYKMHGDIDDPNNIVVTQSDYADYASKYHIMASRLETELSAKTFLFLGFGLADPNFTQIISRNKVRFGANVHRHYAIMKAPTDEYESRKFSLFEQSVNSLGVQIVRIAAYEDLLSLLRQIRDACPRMPEIISGYVARDRFIVQKLSELLKDRHQASVYICAVFSSFAISDAKEYIDGEPVRSQEHVSAILQERDCLERIVLDDTSYVRLLLCPPDSFDSRNDIRYRNLLAWLKKNRNRKNLEVRCTTLNYYTNLLLVDSLFCIAASYSEVYGYNENSVYYDAKTIDDFKTSFMGRFDTAAIARDIDQCIAYYERLLANNAASASTRGSAWTTVGSRSIHSWREFRLIEDNVRIGAKQVVYSYVEHPGSIIIVPFAEAGSVILVEQFRYLTGRPSLEFPAGRIDDGEDWQAAASRELAEETGYRPGSLSLIGSFFTSNAITNEMVQVVLARDLEFVGKSTHADEVEDTKGHQCTLDVVQEKIAKGEITDGPTICAMHFVVMCLSK